MDAIVSCLAPPLTFADAAIARALHHLSSTMSSESASSSSSSLSTPAPHRHCYSPLLDLPAAEAAYGAPMMTCGDSVLLADSPPPTGRRHHNKLKLAPAGGRAGKRRSRASKRAPTTYISADPTNFRMMVQHVTGAQADTGDDDMRLLMLQQPMLLPGADEASPAAAANNGHQQLQLQQQPCFPTLDSWNVMYQDLASASCMDRIGSDLIHPCLSFSL